MAFGDFLKKAAEVGSAVAQDAKKIGNNVAASLVKKYGVVTSGKYEGCEVGLSCSPGGSVVNRITFYEDTAEKGSCQFKDMDMVRDIGFSREHDFRTIIKIEYSDGETSEILLKKEVALSTEFKRKVLNYEKFANKLKTEKEEAERQKNERARKEKLEKIMIPSCEKGDCLWNNEKFYYTCDECVECNRKNSTKNMQGKVKYPQLWKYMKRFEQSEKDMDEKVEEVRIAEEYFSGKFGVTLEEGKFNNGYKDTEDIEKIAAYNVLVEKRGEISKVRDQFASELFEEFMPGFTGNVAAALEIEFNGITNSFFDLIWDLNRLGISLTTKQTNILAKGEIEFSGDLGALPLDIEDKLFRNPTLYDRSDDDFIYTLKAFAVMQEENNPLIKKFITEDNTILPAGIGGPKAGFYDPCIWSIVNEDAE